MKNIFMNKRYLNFGGITCLILGVYSVCGMLLNDGALPWSISWVEAALSHLAKHWRVVMVGLMPIYVAFTLFGSAVCGLFVGSTVHHWLMRLLHEKKLI